MSGNTTRFINLIQKLSSLTNIIFTCLCLCTSMKVFVFDFGLVCVSESSDDLFFLIEVHDVHVSFEIIVYPRSDSGVSKIQLRSICVKTMETKKNND